MFGKDEEDLNELVGKTIGINFGEIDWIEGEDGEEIPEDILLYVRVIEIKGRWMNCMVLGSNGKEQKRMYVNLDRVWALDLESPKHSDFYNKLDKLEVKIRYKPKKPDFKGKEED